MTGQVVYIAPDFAKPSGGMRAIYRHAEVAKDAGLDAKVWHHAEDFKCDWFTTSASVVRGATLELGPDDLLVVPEVMVMTGFDPAPGCRKAIFNQNHFYTFDNWTGERYPGWSPKAPVWTASDVSATVLRRLHPDLTVEQIPYAIDTEMFRFGTDRRRRVVWMPRKRPREAAVLMALFTSDPRFADVEFLSLDDVSEAQTADVLADTSVFVALGHEEGFGLPVAEALASGCSVVGHPAGGGAELFTAPGTHVVDAADVLGVVEEVARVLAAAPSDEERQTYRQRVLDTYTTDQMRPALLAAIESVRKTPGAAGTATHPLGVFVDAADTEADQVERSHRYAEEQREAREQAQAMAKALEESFQNALAQLEDSRRRVNVLTQELADLRVEYAELGTAAERLTALDETTSLLAQYTRDNDRLNRRIDDEIVKREAELLHVRRTLEEKIEDLQRSTSWKVTAPLRKATSAIRGERNA